MQEIWLYLAALGFLAGVLLWPYLLWQYRNAEETYEEGEEEPFLEPEPEIEPVPVIIRLPSSPSATLPLPSAALEERPFPETATGRSQRPGPSDAVIPGQVVAAVRAVPVSETGSASTVQPAGMGELSPAAVYLKEMKTLLDNLHRDVRGVKEQVLDYGNKRAEEFDVILNQLGNLKQKERETQSRFESLAGQIGELRSQFHDIHQLQSSPPSEETVSPTPALEPASAPDEAVGAGAPQEVPAETILYELEKAGAFAPAAGEQPPAPAAETGRPELAAPAPAPEKAGPEPMLDFTRDVLPLKEELPTERGVEEPPKPKRRGPVWPV